MPRKGKHSHKHRSKTLVAADASTHSAMSVADEPDQIPPRYVPLIRDVKHNLHTKLEEIENTASLAANSAKDATDVLERYKSRFAMSITGDEFTLTIYRFLVAHKESVSDAVDALLATGEFRHRQNIDRMAVFTSLIPIRGYDENEVCRALKLPMVGDVLDGASEASQQQIAADAPEQVLQTEINAFYSNSYSQVFEDGDGNGDGDLPMHTHRDGPSTSPQPTTEMRRKSQSGSFAGPDTKAPQRGFLARFVSHLNPFARKEAELRDTNSANDQVHSRKDTGAQAAQSPRRGQKAGEDVSSSSSHFDTSEGDDQSAQLETSGRATADPEQVLFMDTNQSGVYIPPSSELATPCLNFHDLLAPIVQLMLRHAPMSFHYWDRAGRPVLYVDVSPLRSRAWLRELNTLCPVSTEPKAVVMLYQTYVLEVLMQLIRYRDLKNRKDNEIRDALLRQSGNATLTSNVLPKKGRVFNAVVVIDCKNAKVKHFMSRPLIQMIKPIVTLVQRHYPQTLHRLYVVNCHSTINSAYSALRNVLAPETRRKMIFCDSESTPRTLKLIIDGDILPEQLSGRCRCFAGCIPVPRPTRGESSDSTSADSGTSHTSLSASMSTQRLFHSPNSPSGRGERLAMQFISKCLKLNARKAFRWSICVAQNEEIMWEYREVHRQPITFAIVFTDAIAGNIYEVVPRGRATQGANHFIATSPGVLIFEWSNRRSRFTKRKIRIKLYRDGEMTGFDEEDNWI